MEHFCNKNFSLPVYLFSCFPADPGCCTPGTSVSWTFCITVILITGMLHIHIHLDHTQQNRDSLTSPDQLPYGSLLSAIRKLAPVSAGRLTKRTSASPVCSMLCCLPGSMESLFPCFPVSLFHSFLYSCRYHSPASCPYPALGSFLHHPG